MTHTMTAATVSGNDHRSTRRLKAHRACAPAEIYPEVCSPQKRQSAKRRSNGQGKSRKSVPAGFWMALFAWIIAIIIISGSLNETFSLAQQKPHLLEIQVEKGDTLWGIAQDLNNTVFNHAHDLRYLIYVIEEANDLSSPVIQPGQILKVPMDL